MQGLFFWFAKIRIGKEEWNGHIELHVTDKAWYQHQHDKDKSYDNVILHVIWDGDEEVRRAFRTKVNADAFQELAELILLHCFISTVKDEESEALVLGIAGFLGEGEVFEDQLASNLHKGICTSEVASTVGNDISRMRNLSHAPLYFPTFRIATARVANRHRRIIPIL
ncbi:hypothetical protein FQR65_LT18345 [Abscondita terminalis]|nr:hypothetical protein FQR65_LT18345 [Abscondita terminalis]